MFFDYLKECHTYSITPFLGFVVFVCLVVISLFRGRKNPTNLLFAGICFLVAVINIDVALVSIISNKTLALKIDRLSYLFLVFILPVYIQFVHSFLGISRRKWLVYLACSLSLIFLLFTQTDLFISGFNEYSFGTIARAGPVYHLFSLMAISAVLYCILTLFMGMKKATDNQQKNRIKYVLAGMGLSTILVSLNYLPVSGLNVYPMGNFSFIPAIILAFGVLKYDLLDIGTVIRRGTIYFSLTAILTVLYIFMIYLFNVLFMWSGYSNPVVLSFFLALLIVLLFNPIKIKVQECIDKLFFRGKYDYQKTLKEISGKMTSLLKFDEITRFLLDSISEALQVSYVELLIYNDEKECFQPYSYQSELPVGIEKNHPLITFLEKNKKSLSKPVIDRASISEEDKNSIINILNTSKTSLVIPMISKEKLTGIISLGEKKSEELFVHEDLELLTTVANQSAIAIENARNYEKLENLNIDLERKVEERTADLKRTLEEKEKTQKQLIQSESLAAIGQLVAGTAHELNNPLSSASSLIQTSIESMDTPEEKDDDENEIIDDLKFSLKELKRARDIVRSLLDLSRQTQTYIEPVNINLVIEDALRVLHNQYKYLNVNIEKDFDETLPEIEGNFANLGQVFINIIKNAIQALPEGKGKISLITRYRKETNSVIAECHDTGNGIPPEIIKDIFKPFFTTKGVGTGTGLGLYISHEIIKKHGGDIHIKSETGNGSTFTVTLPLKKA
ncbi:MAG: ATP-binding protein [Thermodesulfobacteriota bacterium]|nr:ATP-binding protein [Thermodesulfobacteriota bacterium]